MNHTKANVPMTQIVDSFFNTSISDLLGADFTSSTPAVNIIEKETSFNIELAVPGFQKGDFQIEVKNNKLTVSAEIKEEESEEKDAFTRKEYNYSSFSRSFHLPKTVDADKIEAAYTDGLLNIQIDKKEEAVETTKTIEIS
jgi:HSP20 family protein